MGGKILELHSEKMIKKDKRAGRVEVLADVAISMLKDHKPVEEIVKYTKLPLKRVQELEAGIQ